MAASVREMVRQQVAAEQAAAASTAGSPIDALTALQVEKNARLGTEELVERHAANGAEGGARSAAYAGTGPQPHACPRRRTWTGEKESWTFGYLVDTILTRDPFMHRIDIAPRDRVTDGADGRARGPDRRRRRRGVGGAARAAVRRSS